MRCNTMLVVSAHRSTNTAIPTYVSKTHWQKRLLFANNYLDVLLWYGNELCKHTQLTINHPLRVYELIVRHTYTKFENLNDILNIIRLLLRAGKTDFHWG